MKRLPFVFSILAVCAMAAYPCFAKAPKPPASSIKQPAPLPPQTYEMSLISVSGGPSCEYIFVINNRVGYRTVASLKGFVANLPPGSTLRWAPDDSRRLGEPLMSSAAIADFGAFCRSKKIRFVLIPGG